MTGAARSRSTIAKLGIAGLVAAGLAAASGAPALAAATGSTTFSVRPANPDPTDPLTRSYFRPVLTPGATAQEAVTVDNTGGEPVELFVYPVDGLTGATSGTVFANHSDPLTRAGSWLTASVSSVTIGAHQEQVVPFRIAVPANASPGDHVAGIAFEDAHPTRSPGFSVTEVIREVIGVQIRVPGPGDFQLHIGGVSFEGPPAAPVESLLVQLGDTGNRLGQAVLIIKLSGPAGYSHAINAHLDTLLPGDTIAYPVPWPEALAPGPYTVSIIGSGTQPVSYQGTAQLVAPPPGSVPVTTPPNGSPPVTAPAGAGAAPRHRAHHGAGALALVVGLAALLVLAGAYGSLVLARRRRGQPPPSGATTGEPPVPAGADPPVATAGAATGTPPPTAAAGPTAPPSPATWQKSAIGAPRQADHPARR